MYVAESFLAGGTAYLAARRAARGNAAESAVFDSGDVAAVVVSLGVQLLSFSGLTVAGVSGRPRADRADDPCLRAAWRAFGRRGGGASRRAPCRGLDRRALLPGRVRPRRPDGGRVLSARKDRRRRGVRNLNGIASLQVSGSMQVFYGAVEVAAASILLHGPAAEPAAFKPFRRAPGQAAGRFAAKNVILRLRYGGRDARRIGIRR